MTSSPSYIEDCLKREVLFVTGKGGVGKSTLAWATARACAARGKRVAVTSWNPLEKTPHAAPIVDHNVRWIPLDVSQCFREYASRILKFQTIYNVIFENHVLQTFIRATPGIAETVVAGKVWDLWFQKEQDLLIVDLPSSGHAVSFFQSPLGVHKIFAVGFVHKESEKIMELFQAETTRLDLVALPEELPIVEASELKRKLEGTFPLRFGYCLVNQCTPAFPLTGEIPEAARDTVERHRARLASEAENLKAAEAMRLPLVKVPRFPTARSEETLRGVMAHLETA